MDRRPRRDEREPVVDITLHLPPRMHDEPLVIFCMKKRDHQHAIPLELRFDWPETK